MEGLHSGFTAEDQSEVFFLQCALHETMSDRSPGLIRGVAARSYDSFPESSKLALWSSGESIPLVPLFNVVIALDWSLMDMMESLTLGIHMKGMPSGIYMCART